MDGLWKNPPCFFCLFDFNLFNKSVLFGKIVTMHEIVTAEKIVAGGDCLAKINGKNVFVPFAIPGEKLEIEIVKSFRDYDTAKIIRIVEPSPYRVEPSCPLYGKCGGCNMQHISPDYQVELRKQILKSSFEREGIPCPEIEVISGNDRNYRCRIQLTDGGFNERESNKIVPLDDCGNEKGFVNIDATTDW